MLKSKIKNIFVPLDGSKNSIRGLDIAINIARQCQATLTGIYVIPRPPHPSFRSSQYLEKPLLKDAQNIMDFAKNHSAQNGILFEGKITFGDPAHIIVEFAKRKKFDLIVIGARGRGSLKEIFFGSVSNYVLHKSTIPVMIVK